MTNVVEVGKASGHGRDVWHLISVADQAMYNAKGFDMDAAANDRAAYVAAAIAS